MSKFLYLYQDPTDLNQVTSSTPGGIYSTDKAFVSESLQVCKWTARRLGHPVMQLEFGSGSIFTCWEEAVSEYSYHINNYNMKNWLWESYGAETRTSETMSMSTGSFNPIHGHLGTTFTLAKQYGEAIDVGGDIDLYTGSIKLTASKQEYDLQTEAIVNSAHSGSRLEIHRIFNQGPASLTRFYDPFAGSFDQQQMLDGFGMGSSSPAISFIMRPISHDIVRANMIETSDLIRKSAYSFELINNKLRIFPRPVTGDAGEKVYFHYKLMSDKQTVTRNFTSGKVSDPSNAPFRFVTYAEINSAGRQWIKKYTLALCKELLGIIRSKYAALPLPGGEVTMDGESLKAEGREEKTALVEELKEFLDSVSLTEKTKAEQEQAEANSAVLARSPLTIYIG